MTENSESSHTGIVNRRERSGTWLWFIANVLLFPAPAYFTLLRIREYSFGRVLLHMGVIVILVLVLLSGALLQLVVPAAGRLWMLLPVASGLIVLYANRSLKQEFSPLQPTGLARSRGIQILYLVLFFTGVSLLPSLNLVELNQKQLELHKWWIVELPFWQGIPILLAGIFLLLAGYASNADGKISVNRAFILYSGYTAFLVMLTIVFVFGFEWLKLQGGAWNQLLISLLAAILALDYWNARSFGQYIRRFFFLTLTKAGYAIFFWFCLAGLPQKAASTYLVHCWDKIKPPGISFPTRYLMFSGTDRFESAHSTCQRMRAASTRAIVAGDTKELLSIADLLYESKGILLPETSHLSFLSEKIRKDGMIPLPHNFKKVPLIRPVQSDWDVMLTALLVQNTIDQTDLKKHIAGFKTMLPKNSYGLLPGINHPYKVQYIALATGTRADFVPPSPSLVTILSEAGFCPVFRIPLAGTNYWAALLQLDHKNKVAWLRMENAETADDTVKTFFDANESGMYRDEILSRSLFPMPLEYLTGRLTQSGEPVVVFTREGLEKEFPDHFSRQDLAEMEQAAAYIADNTEHRRVPYRQPDGPGIFSRYIAYSTGVAYIKSHLEPANFDPIIFNPPSRPYQLSPGRERFRDIEKIIDSIDALKDSDRFQIASLMIDHQHLYGAPELFAKLIETAPFSSDVISCSDAFAIGRHLFLMGRQKAGFRYLKLAFMRHPFNTRYEIWYRIAGAKLDTPPAPFLSPPTHQPDLYLYYRTVVDCRDGDTETARQRLEQVLEKDSHNSLAHHLLARYFDQPVDQRYFFPVPEGL